MHVFCRSLVAILLFFVSAPGNAATPTILLDEANPPFAYGTQHPMGLYPALLREALRRAGQPINLESAPLKRVLSALDVGEGGVGGLYKDAETAGRYDLSLPLFDEVLLLYVRHGQGFPYLNLNSLEGRTVGVVRARSYGELFEIERKRQRIKIVETRSDQESMQSLADGRLNVVIATREAGTLALAAGNLNDVIEALPMPFGINGACVAFSRDQNRLDLVLAINRALTAMKSDGSFDRIVASVTGK